MKWELTGWVNFVISPRAPRPLPRCAPSFSPGPPSSVRRGFSEKGGRPSSGTGKARRRKRALDGFRSEGWRVAKQGGDWMLITSVATFAGKCSNLGSIIERSLSIHPYPSNAFKVVRYRFDNRAGSFCDYFPRRATPDTKCVRRQR